MNRTKVPSWRNKVVLKTRCYCTLSVIIGQSQNNFIALTRNFTPIRDTVVNGSALLQSKRKTTRLRARKQTCQREGSGFASEQNKKSTFAVGGSNPGCSMSHVTLLPRLHYSHCVGRVKTCKTMVYNAM